MEQLAKESLTNIKEENPEDEPTKENLLFRRESTIENLQESKEAELKKSIVSKYSNSAEIESEIRQFFRAKYNKILVKKTRTKWVSEDYKQKLGHGWYCLHCDSCDRECHRDCKDPLEGNSSEYRCNVIGTLSHSCLNCSCHYSKHSFHDYVWRTKEFEVKEEYEEYEDDPKSIANEEEKKKEQRIDEYQN